MSSSSSISDSTIANYNEVIKPTYNTEENQIVEQNRKNSIIYEYLESVVTTNGLSVGAVIPEMKIDKELLAQLPIIQSIKSEFLYVYNASDGNNVSTNSLSPLKTSTIDLEFMKDGEALFVYQEAGDSVNFTYRGLNNLTITKTGEGDAFNPPTYTATMTSNRAMSSSLATSSTITNINPYTPITLYNKFTLVLGSTIVKKNDTIVSVGEQMYFNGTDNSKYYKSHTVGGIGRTQNRAIQRYRNRKT